MKTAKARPNLEIFLVLLIVATFIFALLILGYVATQNRYKAELKGEIATVSWQELNFRKEAGNGEIIRILYEGAELKLTGNFKEASIGGDYADMWYEVTTPQGEVGWVFRLGITVS